MNSSDNLYPNLPKFCFGLLQPNQEIIVIRNGGLGYHHHYGGTRTGTEESVREMNAELGVTPSQAKAMQAGSMFGWHVPAANPDNYDEHGRLR